MVVRTIIPILICSAFASHGRRVLDMHEKSHKLHDPAHYVPSHAQDMTTRTSHLLDELNQRPSGRQIGISTSVRSLRLLLLSSDASGGWQGLTPHLGFRRLVPRLRTDLKDTNSTLLYSRIKKDIVFFERFTGLLIRTVQKIPSALRRLLTYSVGFPPRVVLVELVGVIASDDDMRLASYCDSARPELLSRDAIASSPRSIGDGMFEPNIINLGRCDEQLTKAFNAPGSRAVVLMINSPGGSPAQSSLIYQRLRTLRKRHKRMPLIVFIEDAAVSGGYYIASAADEIIADPSSLVGSVGVISRGFGYVKAIKKKGITRRVRTAGKHKGGIDPYLPERNSDIVMHRRLLKEFHNNFITDVKAGRGDRLKPEEAAKMHWRTVNSDRGWTGRLFSKPSKRELAHLVEEGAGLFDGSVYSGEVGKQLGLVDGLGEMRTEMQKRFGRHVRIEKIDEPGSKIDMKRLLRWLL